MSAAARRRATTFPAAQRGPRRGILAGVGRDAAMPVLLLALLLPAADAGDVDPGLREKIASPNPAARREAVQRWAANARISEKVWRASDSFVPVVEHEFAPRHLGPTADRAAHRFPVLILAHMLGDPDADVRAAAALGIQEPSAFGLPGAGPALPVGVALARIDDPNPRVRLAAALVRSGAGAEPARAVPVLLEALADPKRPLAVETIEAVGAFGPAVPGWAAARLAKRLGDADGLVRLATALALRDIGPAARTALPQLTDCLEGRDAALAVAAAEAVWRITGRWRRTSTNANSPASCCGWSPTPSPRWPSRRSAGWPATSAPTPPRNSARRSPRGRSILCPASGPLWPRQWSPCVGGDGDAGPDRRSHDGRRRPSGSSEAEELRRHWEHLKHRLGRRMVVRFT
jgi:hypothetical protein